MLRVADRLSIEGNRLTHLLRFLLWTNPLCGHSQIPVEFPFSRCLLYFEHRLIVIPLYCHFRGTSSTVFGTYVCTWRRSLAFQAGRQQIPKDLMSLS